MMRKECVHVAHIHQACIPCTHDGQVYGASCNWGCARSALAEGCVPSMTDGTWPCSAARVMCRSRVHANGSCPCSAAQKKARTTSDCSECTQLICMAKFRKRTVICHAASCPSIECNLHHCMHAGMVTYLAQYSSNLVAGSRSRSLSHISISCFVCFCQSSSDMPDKSVPSRRSKPLTTTMVRNGDKRLTGHWVCSH